MRFQKELIWWIWFTFSQFVEEMLYFVRLFVSSSAWFLLSIHPQRSFVFFWDTIGPLRPSWTSRWNNDTMCNHFMCTCLTFDLILRYMKRYMKFFEWLSQNFPKLFGSLGLVANNGGGNWINSFWKTCKNKLLFDQNF